MPPPEPELLLEQARRLADGQPRQEDLRRAVSAAYYALFHAVTTAAADYAIGADKRTTKQYALAYRSINHGPLKALCLSLDGKQELAGFAAAFAELQEKRHRADYDPHYDASSTDADIAIRLAADALASFRTASEEQRNIFLALSLFSPRKGAG